MTVTHRTRVLRAAAVAVLASAVAVFHTGTAVSQDAAGPGGAATASPPPGVEPVSAETRAATARVLDEIRLRSRAHERLRVLCEEIGARLSGSQELEDAVAWSAATFAEDGLVVRREKVMVPVWRRGEESLELTEPRASSVAMLGLGGSIGTPAEGVLAEVVVAADFDALEKLGDACKGKIVLFNKAMPPYDPERGAGYGETVVYRSQGASRAAAKGAVACLVRSVTATSLRTPHTGMLSYTTDAPRIPAAAVSTEDADRIARLVAAGRKVTARLRMGATFAPDVPSANVVAEIRGSEKPEEIVLLAAHLDSWDVGQGAQDDGGGCMAVMEALRAIAASGVKPKRTIRGVLFVNEENGLRGAMAYARERGDEARRHVAAIEADSGTYAPLGFTSPAPKPGDAKQAAVRARLASFAELLAPTGATRIKDGGGGADIGPLAPAGVPQIGLMVEGSRYFDVHHTHADTFDRVAKADLDACASSLAVLALAISELPGRLDAPLPAVAAPDGASPR